ncbi:Integrase [uncultured Clostridium sp.]|uniref:Integrase DNA-binding domain-containing protein n=1 Tax=Muricoprocola aceti TaxID=2981772 RepID=A0ABT2SKC2_9FIRM|nr:integrase DNA-binding domain-containing protein [Muricoprocola aceti]MCU6724949.1 integrase DNA-binding domain-containing protein [Muricoprocola aceti]SCH31828.1 Integrase [uncultured Clostridium sp.]
MAQTRKDLRGRVLRKGESQRRSDDRYVYTYTDPLGRRKYVYAQDLVTLREKEAQLMKDQMDGLDIYVAGKATVNFVFDRYMSLKSNLKPTTKSNYLYMYDRFIRDTFGKRNIAEIKYSDVVQFYNHLIEKQELQINTLETVHTLLHPTFQLAVKDAFEMIWEEQKENGWTDAEIDGMTGFVFCNRYGNVMNAQSVNRAIKRISSAYNATEEVEAKKEHREPVLLPNFSAHSLRHTFCTRLCERETNLKVIQSIMGHKDIQTTMDIYAEATEEKKQETFEHLAATMDVF